MMPIARMLWIPELLSRPKARRRRLAAMPIAVECCEPRVVLSASPNGQFVGQLYMDLHQELSVTTSAQLSRGLRLGTLTRSQVAANVLNTDAYRQQVVTDLFTINVGSLTAEQRTRFVSSVASGGTSISQLTASALATPEFSTYINSFPTNADFVSAINNLFSQQPLDPTAATLLVTALDLGITTRAGAISTVANSPIFQRGLVNGLYTKFLFRNGTAAELDPLVTRLQNNARVEDVAVTFYASPEYFDSARARFTVAPDLILSNTAVTFTEGGLRQPLDLTAIAGDSDIGDPAEFPGSTFVEGTFAFGSLTVTITNPSAGDLLLIRNRGTGAGLIGFNSASSQVTFGGVVIGNGGASGSTLTVNFNNNVTADGVQALVRNIFFNNLSVAPSVVPRSINVQLRDNDFKSVTATKIVNVVALARPQLTLTAGAINYQRGRAKVTVDPGVTITAADSPTLVGGQLIVSTTAPPATFTRQSNDVTKVISFDASASSILNVSGVGSRITDLNVSLNINHTNDADLRITLQSPSGTIVVLSNRRGSFGDNFTNTIFDDEAAQLISAGAAPFSGSFRPESSLSALDQQLIDGEWRLLISDGGIFNNGVLNSWSLTFSTPPSVVDANDRLQVPNIGTGAGQVGILYEGTTRFVLFEGTKVGTLTGGAGASPLVLQIGVGATPAAIQAVARSIVFGNTSTSAIGARQIEFKVSNNLGRFSLPVLRTIDVTV